MLSELPMLPPLVADRADEFGGTGPSLSVVAPVEGAKADWRHLTALPAA